MTRDQIDRLLEHAILSDDHVALALRLTEMAETYEAGDVSRASLLTQAADEWKQAGRPSRALEIYQQALEDGGASGIDPRTGIADTLFELDRPDEARNVIEAIRADGVQDPAVLLTISETLAAYGDLEAAHQWATEGLELCRSLDAGPELSEPLRRLRYRIRVDLRLPDDD